MKNVLKIALLFLALSAAPLSATTHVTMPGSYSDTHIIIDNDIADNGVALTITAVSGNPDIEIECGDHWVTSNFDKPIVIAYVPSNIYMHNCRFYAVSSYGIFSFFNHVATVASGYFYGQNNWYYNTIPDFEYSGKIYSNTETIWYGVLSIKYCAGAAIASTTVDNSGGGNTYVSGFFFIDTPDIWMDYDTVFGGSGAGGQGVGGYGGGNTDDGIVFECTHADSSPCAGPAVYHFRADDVYDAWIEFIGSAWDGVDIEYGTANRPLQAGLACYGETGSCSFTNSLFANNAVYGNQYKDTRLMNFYSNGNGTSFFTSNTVSSNTLTPYSGRSPGGSTIGFPSTALNAYLWAWNTISGNTISSNDFGSTSTLHMQQVSGYSGSGNTCAALDPSGSSVSCP